MLTRSGGIFDVAGKQQRLEEIAEISNDPAFWNDQARSQKVLKERSALERVVKLSHGREEGIDDAETLYELCQEADDIDTLQEKLNELVLE